MVREGIVLPFLVGSEQSTSPLALGKRLVAPQMHKLIELADLGMKISDQIAENTDLDAQTSWVVILVAGLASLLSACGLE